jgi:hypothetical protein
VTLGDFSRPFQISRFIKEVHAGFQLLNLKNDSLRRKSDGIKYAVCSPSLVFNFIRNLSLIVTPNLFQILSVSKGHADTVLFGHDSS